MNTSLNVRQAQRTIAQQQTDLKQLRSALGVFEVKDLTKAHFIFVRQTEEMAWRWRVYLPTKKRYMMKWAFNDVPNEGLASHWRGQEFQPLVSTDDPTFLVDAFIRTGSDGNRHWVVRCPWSEMNHDFPADHPLVSPSEPIVMRGQSRFSPGELMVSDSNQPLVLLRYQIIPRAEYDAAQAQGEQPAGPFPGIMVWIEPAP